MLDANELERMARERPDKCFLKGSGVLKLTDAIRQLESEVARLKRGHKTLGECIHNMTVAQQSAWIEWKHGEGADAAMVWIHNGLAGPGFIPDEEAPYGKEAQAWYDANNANPLPACHCGRPANIAWKDGSACSNAHYREAKARQEAAAGVAVPDCTEPNRAACPRLCMDFCNKAETERERLLNTAASHDRMGMPTAAEHYRKLADQVTSGVAIPGGGQK